MYVNMVDEVVLLGFVFLKDSYLKYEVIIFYVKNLRVDVIYFGYGFLFENVDFV